MYGRPHLKNRRILWMHFELEGGMLPAEGRMNICAQVKTNWRKWSPRFMSSVHSDHSLLTPQLPTESTLCSHYFSCSLNGRLQFKKKWGRRGEESELPLCIWRCRTRRLCSVKVKLFHNEHNMGIMTKLFFFPGSKVMILNIIGVSQIHTTATQSFSFGLTPLVKAWVLPTIVSM